MVRTLTSDTTTHRLWEGSESRPYSGLPANTCEKLLGVALRQYAMPAKSVPEPVEFTGGGVRGFLLVLIKFEDNHSHFRIDCKVALF